MEHVIHRFRSAVFGGFNRRDVLEYIESTDRESSRTIQTLTGELEQARQEKAALAAELDGLRSQSGDLADQEAKIRASLEESSRSLATVRGELQTTRTQLAVAKKELADLQDKVAQLEPMAQRYEALKDRVATVELDAHQKAQATVDKAQAEVDELRSDTARWMGEIRTGYDRLRAQVRECADTAAQAEAAMAGLEDEYQALLRRGLGEQREEAVPV